MTLAQLIKALNKSINEGIPAEKEIEFCIIDRFGLSLLSIYERNDEVFIDIGTSEDSEKCNLENYNYYNRIGKGEICLHFIGLVANGK